MKKQAAVVPLEVLTLPEGLGPLRAANKLLKEHGLVLRWRGAGGDQVVLRVERLGEKA